MYFMPLLSLNKILSTMMNTFFVNILFITVAMAFSVILTILFTEITIRVFKPTERSTTRLSYALFWVVMSMVLHELLSGADLNGFDWYLDPGVRSMVLTIIRVWLWAGYISIFYLSAITSSIPDDVFEVARVDGISAARIAWQVIRPLFIPTVISLLLVVSVNSLVIRI